MKEFQLLSKIRAVVGLGKIGFDSAFDCFRELGWTGLKTRPQFGHRVLYALNANVSLIGSYHPSQQNTFTGKLTEKMFNDIFITAKQILEG